MVVTDLGTNSGSQRTWIEGFYLETFWGVLDLERLKMVFCLLSVKSHPLLPWACSLSSDSMAMCHICLSLLKKKITCFVEKQKGIESSLICGSLPNCLLMVGAESAMRGRVSSIWSSHFLPHRCATTGRCTQKQSVDLNLGTHRMWVVQGVALPLLPVLPFGLHSAKLLHHKDPWIDGNASPRLWIYPEHFGEQRAWRCRPLRGRVWEFSLTPKLASFMVQISFSHRW